jgi:nucleoside-diphosphate-sugar epimerase
MKSALVLGGGGFIGNHLVKRLKSNGYTVVAVDLKYPEFDTTSADEFIIGDLRRQDVVKGIFTKDFDEVYQLAADMGGAGFIFTGENDADIMHNSAQININVAETLKHSKTKLFYSSSACIYPEENQLDAQNPNCAEDSAFPANPDSEYGWEKLFSERLYTSYARNYGLNVRIARFHNIFGPLGTYIGGREKAPAALARKVAEATNGDSIEVWGSGEQTRSFLYIDECLEGIDRLMTSEVKEPINIGSAEMVTINELTHMVIALSGKDLSIKNIDGPIGVNGRCSDNRLIASLLHWQPNYPLQQGMEILYTWVHSKL